MGGNRRIIGFPFSISSFADFSSSRRTSANISDFAESLTTGGSRRSVMQTNPSLPMERFRAAPRNNKDRYVGIYVHRVDENGMGSLITHIAILHRVGDRRPILR